MSKVTMRRGATFCLLALALVSLLLPMARRGIADDTSQWTGSKIVIDYSHGQYRAVAEYLDQFLAANLTDIGFEVVFATAGINSTILSDATGLVVSSIYETTNAFLEAELTAIADWFNSGHKFLWVGYDSDFLGTGTGQWILDNMTAILERVGSHVYGEPTSVQDPVSCAVAAYRVIANRVSSDPFVADCVANVGRVLVHSPTILYGSESDTPGENIGAAVLEDVSLEDVYPLLYHSPNATIVDSDTLLPYAHNDGQVGAFVSVSIEVEAGASETGVIVVSGGNPIGYYWPMTVEAFYGQTGLAGQKLVIQTICFGVQNALEAPDVTTTSTTTAAGSSTTANTLPTVYNLVEYGSLAVTFAVLAIVIVFGGRIGRQ